MVGALDAPPGDEPQILNVGNHRAEEVLSLVRLLEAALGRNAIIQSAPRPSVDVEETFASVEKIGGLTGFSPSTRLEDGIPRFVAWFRAWHAI